MKSRLFRSLGVIVAMVLFIFALNVFAIETDKGLTLDDGSGDSPQVILRDQGDKTLTLQKMDAGEADIVNNEGDINLKPSGDTDDYLKVLTTGNASYLYWLGILAYTNNPGLRVNPATGELEYRDEDSASWVTLDSLGGGGGGGGISNVVEDTTPQLGGDLDVNGNNITSTAGLNVSIGSSAGNDFTVDTSKLVVEGDTGNIGIGTTNPGSTLHIVSGESEIRIDSTTVDVSIAAEIEANSNGVNLTVGAQSFADDQGAIGTDSNHPLRFYTNGNHVMSLDTGGNVGIGTTSPDGKLDVEGGGIYVSEIAAPGTPNAGKGVVYAKSDGKLYFKDDGGTETDLTAAGGGGISDVVDDTTPQLGGQLDVNGNSIGDGTLELLSFSETASAVNELTIKNAATGNAPELQATGGDTNIDLELIPKGTGVISVAGTTNYENNVSGDDDIPNKKWIDDQSFGTGTGDITAVGDVTSGNAFTATAGNDGTTLYFEGSTSDANEVALTSADPGADVTVTIPASTGTLYISDGTDVAVADGGTGASNAAGAKTNLGFISDVVDDTTPQLGGQLDVNDNSIGDGTLELLSFSETASAVNELTIKNAATGGAPELQATGGDTNIDLELIPKGTGVISVAGTTNYEDNVSGDDDIPNKKWIDDQGFGTGSGDITAVGDVTSGAAFTATAGNDGTTLYFEGSTSDANEVALTSADPGTDVTVTIPASTGTLYISGGTDVAVADGGTGASNAAGAKTNLGFISDVVDDTTPQLGGQLDINGNSIGDGTLELLSFSETASAVNELTIKNAATGGAPELQATGGDTNIDLELIPKGTGVISVAGTTNYENNVSDDDDIPNKKWIDDQGFGTGSGDITAVGDVTTGNAFTATAGNDGTTLYFEGSTSDANEVALTSADPGADVTVTIPASTGTLYISDGTDVAVADGGTGASNAAGAKTNLGFISDVVDDTTPQLGGQLDINGNSIGDGTLELLSFSETASAVNELTIKNAATGNAPELSTTGGDTNIDFKINAKGTGDLILQDTATGNVGIGTTSPGSALEVTGQIRHTLGIISEGQGSGSVVGNARGTGAIDLQTNRSAATQVASGNYTVIGGGQNNTASGANGSTVGGGFYNAASGTSATVGGGDYNTASGTNATVGGGQRNTASGDYSWAGGRYMQLTSNADRSFVWGYSDSSVSINTPDAFIIYSGNVGIGTTSPNQILTLEGTMSLKEQAAANADTAAYGQIWVKTATPNQLWFTDDAGTDVQLGAGGGGISNVVEDTTPQLGGQLDVNGNSIGDGTLELIKFSETASAVNELTIKNAATGNAPELQATGGDTNIDLELIPKGTGVISVAGTTNYENNVSGDDDIPNKKWIDDQGFGTGTGDITAVGDVTSGNAFTATAGNDGTTLYFEGTTSDANEVALTSADPGADVTVTIPASTGTLYISDGTDVAVADGGTGASNAAGAKTNLGFITDVVDDTTPQLGGQLDVNGNSIGDGTLELLSFSETASAVNELTIKNAATANAPELSTTGGDTNIDFKINAKGTGDLILQDTATGNVGIGTTNPTEAFQVATEYGGNIRTYGRLGIFSPSISHNIYHNGSAWVNDDTGDGSGGVKFDIAGGVSFHADPANAGVAPTTRMTILNNGYVGIGDTDPDAWFEVSDSAGGSVDLFMLSSNDNLDGDRFIVKNSGNVGIGTTSPNQILTLEGTMSLKEQVAANADTAAYGQIWVKTVTPNQLWFTDDAGTDVHLGAGGGGGISDVVDDTTPQLGGQLDVNGNSIGDGTLELLSFSETSSAVNELTITNAATGNAPELAATGDDTNIDFKINAKGTGDLILQDTATGNVGIGTTNPAHPLDVSGRIRTTSVISTVDGTVGFPGHTFNNWSNRGMLVESGDLAFTVAGEKMRITSSGNVGIGTTSPNQKLTLEGAMSLKEQAAANADTAAYGQVWVKTATPNQLWFTDDAGTDVQLGAGGGGGISDVVDDTTPQLGGQLDVNGNSIGDGTLELLSFSETASAVNELTIKNAATGNAPELSTTGGDTNIDFKINAKGTGDLILQDTATGNVGIGTTSPGSALDVAGQIRHTLGIISEGQGNGSIVGNARGTGAIDLQSYRGVATRVASDDYTVIGGGADNTASGYASTVSGGWGNTASNIYATVSGGVSNTASGMRSTMGGGGENTVSQPYGTVGGGRSNTASGYASTVSGGYSNTASSQYATVGGGKDNTASGGYSFAAGRRAKANADGVFALADSTDADFVVATADVFGARFNGGYWLTGGNVGIGDTTPDDLLNVHSASAEAAIAITSLGTNTDAVIKFELTDGAPTFTMGVDDSAGDKFKISFGGGLGSNDWFVIDTNRNVGIGDSTPDDLLNVHSAGAEAAIAITSLGTNTDVVIKFELADGAPTFTMGVDDFDSDKFKIGTTAIGTNTRLTIDSSGNVGIGTSSPGSALEVTGQIRHTLGIISEGQGNGSVVGNARGTGAIELQTYRSAATQVASGSYAVIGGGDRNTASGDWSTVGGGYGNRATASGATVPGGNNNMASGDWSTVSGGLNNTASNWLAVVGGGQSNTASSFFATVPGGDDNTASGLYSFAAGRRAKANTNGVFALADSTDADFTVATADVFGARFNGGYWLTGGNVGIGTTSPNSKLEVTGGIGVNRAVAVATGNVDISGSYLTNGADYAEYFEYEELLSAGDIIGVNLESGKVREYMAGDEFIGIVSDNPGFIGNNQDNKEGYVLVGLLGQMVFNEEQVHIVGRIVKTEDGKKIGILLGNGKVLIGI